MVNIQLINVVDRHRFDADPYPDQDPIQVLPMLENLNFFIFNYSGSSAKLHTLFYFSRQRHRCHNHNFQYF
jgi:hypothetical protein